MDIKVVMDNFFDFLQNRDLFVQICCGGTVVSLKDDHASMVDINDHFIKITLEETETFIIIDRENIKDICQICDHYRVIMNGGIEFWFKDENE